jgi:protein-L-isoaspartate(D-aspartate) O-methyltransferase
MVETQIVARGVRNARVLDAMRTVPRHLFVPTHARAESYADRPLPIGQGQTISQPYIVAAMSELLAPEAGDRVLEIGTGSGYQTAVLAALSREVVTIERHAELAAQAGRVLADLKIANVDIRVGDGSRGYPDGGSFDRILVTAGAPAVPESLKAQLAPGGRLVIPVGPSHFQHLLVIDRRGDRFVETQGDACVFVPLIGREGWPST